MPEFPPYYSEDEVNRVMILSGACLRIGCGIARANPLNYNDAFLFVTDLDDQIRSIPDQAYSALTFQTIDLLEQSAEIFRSYLHSVRPKLSINGYDFNVPGEISVTFKAFRETLLYMSRGRSLIKDPHLLERATRDGLPLVGLALGSLVVDLGETDVMIPYVRAALATEFMHRYSVYLQD